jgi:hypothetical protein
VVSWTGFKDLTPLNKASFHDLELLKTCTGHCLKITTVVGRSSSWEVVGIFQSNYMSIRFCV